MTPPEDGNRRKLITLAASGVLFVLGGFVGAYIPQTLAQPRLDLRVARVSIEEPTATLSPEMQAAVDPVLKDLVANHSWIGSFPNGPLSVADYQVELRRIHDQGRRIALSMRALERALNGWATAGSDAQRARKGFELVHPHQGLIMAHIWGEVGRRAEPILDAVDPTTPHHIDLRTDADGDFVLVDGVQSIPIYWSPETTGGSVPAAAFRETGEAIAYGIATGNREFMRQFRDEMTNMLLELDETEQIVDLAKTELRRHSYWFLSVILTNSGADPVSISPRARLYMQVPPQQTEGSVVGATELTMSLRAARLERDESTGARQIADADDPIIVPGGSAISVGFRSNQRIDEDVLGGQLLTVFDSTGLPGIMAVLPITRHIGSLRPATVVTADMEFREFSYIENFPATLSRSN